MPSSRETDDVANGILLCDEHLLLVRQLNKPRPLFWKLPGGRTKSPETREQTLLREVKEETDVDLCGIPLCYLHGFDLIGAQRRRYTQHLFLVRMPGALVRRHLRDIVTCIDPDEVIVESICFALKELPRIREVILPKHFAMLNMFRQEIGF